MILFSSAEARKKKRIADEEKVMALLIVAFRQHLARMRLALLEVWQAWYDGNDIETPLDHLQADTYSAMLAFFTLVVDEVTKIQQRSVTVARSDAQEFLLMIGFLRTVPRAYDSNRVGRLASGMSLNDWVSSYPMQTAAKVRELVNNDLSAFKLVGATQEEIDADRRKLSPSVHQILFDELDMVTGKDVFHGLMLVRNENFGAYQETLIDSYLSVGVGYWMWLANLDSRTCAVCIAMHGSIHPDTEGFGSHTNCRCMPVPYNSSIPRDLIPDGEQWFDEQDEATQRQILGPGKLELYKEGTIRLHDLVGMKHDPSFGNSRYEIPLKDLAR